MMEQKCTMRNNSEFYSEQETKKKCTGKSGESGDIAKNDNIAIKKMTLHYLHYLHYQA